MAMKEARGEDMEGDEEVLQEQEALGMNKDMTAATAMNKAMEEERCMEGVEEGTQGQEEVAMKEDTEPNMREGVEVTTVDVGDPVVVQGALLISLAALYFAQSYGCEATMLDQTRLLVSVWLVSSLHTLVVQLIFCVLQ